MFDRWIAASVVAWALTSTAFCQSPQSAASAGKQPADLLDGTPFVTAKAWAIGDAASGEFLWGHDETEPRQIASTSKIMTAWVVLQLAEKDPSLLDQTITFSERADGTGGSTAGVKAGEHLPVKVLLYGLLLPSGNDASVALAEHFGGHFVKKAADAESAPTPEESYQAFVAEMNRTAKQLGMSDTEYVDPHGLGANEASARDLLRLAHAALKNEAFRSYVGTRDYAATVENEAGKRREISWHNTNRLLGIEGYDGVKTGTTNRAGACLVSSGHRGDDHLLIVVLGASSSDARYTDTRNLFRWAWRQRGHSPMAAVPAAQE